MSFNPSPYLNALRTTGRLADAVRGAAVLLVYLAHLQRHDHAWPTVETIARLTGLTPRAVQLQRAHLVRAGLIVRDGEKLFSGRSFPVYKLAQLLHVEKKSPIENGLSCQHRAQSVSAIGRKALRPMGANSFNQNGVKAEQKGFKTTTPPAGRLAAAVVAALAEKGITGRTLDQLAAVTPPLTPADVAEAMTRAGKARARSLTGWAIAWLKSEDRRTWAAAAAARTAALAAAETAAAAKRGELAARRRQTDQLERSAAQLIGRLGNRRLDQLKTAYLNTIPLPALRLKIGALPIDELKAHAGFRAYLAKEHHEQND